MPNRTIQIPERYHLSSLEQFFSIKKINKETLIADIISTLDHLLNSNPLYSEPMEEKLDAGIVHYGLSGFHVYSAYSQTDLIKMSNLISAIIARFEPRLKDIIVTPITSDVNNDAYYNFKITGTLLIPHYLVPITLESKFTTNPYKVFLTISNIE